MVQGKKEFVITGATLVDHKGGRRGHVQIVGDNIGAVYALDDELPHNLERFEADGLTLMPGLVDIQVHFREPGFEFSETLETGARAASAGGITAVVTMPNTDPAMDSVEAVKDFKERAKKHSDLLDIHTSGALSIGRKGEENVDYVALYEEGVRIFTDDGDCLMDARLMRNALQASTRLPDMVVAQHGEDSSLVKGGVINEGLVSQSLGLSGRPWVGEAAIVARDLELVRETGGRYHLLHMSTQRALELLAQAKEDYLNVSCEVTPQHLVLDEGDVERLGTSGKMNPPLRTASDTKALRGGIADGVIDAIATDHAPHAPELKAKGLKDSPPGMLGVQTVFQVGWTYLVDSGLISPSRLVEILSVRPSQIAGLKRHGQEIKSRNPANLMLVDTTKTVEITAEMNESKSENNPWLGQKLKSEIKFTLKDGIFSYEHCM